MADPSHRLTRISRSDVGCPGCGALDITYNGRRLTHDREACVKHTPAAVSGVHFRGLRDRRVVYDLKINGVNGRYVGTVIDSQGVMLELAQGPDDEDHYWISRTDLVTVLPNRDNELDVERWLGAE